MNPKETKSSPSRRKPVIGIVGGIGAGKSTVAAEFVKLGCTLIDADKIGHELLAEEDVKRELVDRWGPDVIGADGQVDRSAVANLAFATTKGLAALNAIMHPRIRRRIEQSIAACEKDALSPAIVLDAAIMIEAGWNSLCTHMVYVAAPDAQRRQRVEQGRAWDAEHWRTREKSQISLDKKRQRCYFTIDNSSSFSCLSEQVRELLNKIIHESGSPKASVE